MDPLGYVSFIPKDPFVCLKDPGFPQTNPKTWVDGDFLTNPTKDG